MTIRFVHDAGKSAEKSMELLEVSAADFQRDAGRYQDIALRRPVAVTRKGGERTVLISADEYGRLKRRDREVVSLDDFADIDIAALENARAPAETRTFDHEFP